MNRKQLILSAINSAAAVCGGKRQLTLRLGRAGGGVNMAHLYKCANKGGLNLQTAMTIHLITGGEYKWWDLAEKESNVIFNAAHPNVEVTQERKELLFTSIN